MQKNRTLPKEREGYATRKIKTKSKPGPPARPTTLHLKAGLSRLLPRVHLNKFIHVPVSEQLASCIHRRREQVDKLLLH